MQVMDILSEKQARIVGEQLVAMLDLTTNKEGKYNTTWGSKTIEGLGRCAQRIVVETTSVKITVKE